jgi:hypothetical protein
MCIIGAPKKLVMGATCTLVKDFGFSTPTMLQGWCGLDQATTDKRIV